MRTWLPQIIILVLMSIACDVAICAGLERIYLDEQRNVHVIVADGSDKQLTIDGLLSRAHVSSDKKVAAWFVRRGESADQSAESGASKLAIYRDGRVRSITCEPFIRDFWFSQDGNRIAIDCGGTHFAGREILYDTHTLEKLGSFDQATTPVEKRPAWSISSDKFDPSR